MHTKLDDIEYAIDYIPNKITVGLFNYECETIKNNTVPAGFISWKNPKGKWRSPSIFERLCGFKPHKQLDSVKELTKTIKNCVIEYDNVPVSSLKVISWNEDVYSMDNTNNHYDCTHNVLLEDPRGFVIGISNDDFFELLKYSGWNLKDGILNVEVVYASVFYNSGLILLPTTHNKYQEIADKSKKLFEKEKSKDTYITKSQLKVGHVYMSSEHAPFKKGEYMYLGIHNTYSLRCHVEAVRTGKYHLDKYLNNEKRNQDIWQQTTKGRMIFYKINSSEKKWNAHHSALYNPEEIYVARPNISKCFTHEVELDKYAKMYNDSSKKVTYENVLADMQKSIIFNKIKLLNYTPEINNIYCTYRPISYDAFELLLAHNDLANRKHTNKNYIPHYYPKPCNPFSLPFKTTLSHADLTYIGIKVLDDNHNSLIDDGELEYFTCNARYKYNNYYRNNIKFKATFSEIYNKLKPEIPDITLKNGYKISDELASIFIPYYPDCSYDFGY